MTVRQATQADVAAIIQLSARMRAELERYEPRFWRPHPDAAARQHAWFSVLVDDAQHLVAVDVTDSRINGFIVARAADAPPVYDPGGRTCMVDDLVWDGDEGADALLDHVSTWAAEHGCVQLVIVSAAADDARKALLTRRGLKPVSEWWSAAIP